jgi:hypothetical protein
MRFAFASGLLFAGLCLAFCGVYYVVLEIGSSKAHRALLHVVAGSATAAFLVSVLIVLAAVAVRKVREGRDTQRQILEAQRRSGAASSWRSTPRRPD